MERVQVKRVRGWRKPEGAIYVGRPSKWGNPYSVTEHGREQAVHLYREHLAGMPKEERDKLLEPLRTATALCCWCKPSELCHADVLLAYLNNN
jgi:hypothetical protein